MVVTSSRLHAVRYKQAIETYIAKMRYTDLAALVAFSGKVIDEKGLTYTEAQMNGFPESQTAKQLRQRRLPGAHRGREVPDRVRPAPPPHHVRRQGPDGPQCSADPLPAQPHPPPSRPTPSSSTSAMRQRTSPMAFEPYYGRTVAPPTDPNLLFDTRSRLDQYDVLRPEEVEETVAVLLTITDHKDHGPVYALLDPACERFKQLEEQDRLGFKDALDKFVRTYSFLSQVVSFGDSKLERDYIYCRALGLAPPRPEHQYRPWTSAPRLS